jgi:hypothetical protein
VKSPRQKPNVEYDTPFENLQAMADSYNQHSHCDNLVKQLLLMV